MKQWTEEELQKARNAVDILYNYVSDFDTKVHLLDLDNNNVLSVIRCIESDINFDIEECE